MASVRRLEEGLAEALCSDGWFRMHRATMEAVGLESAALLHYLFNVRQRTKAMKDARNDGWFFCTVNKMQKETGLSADQQTRALKKLIDEHGLIEMQKMGLPARRHIRIDYGKLSLILEKWRADERENPASSDRENRVTNSRENRVSDDRENPVTLKKEARKKVSKEKVIRGTSESAPSKSGGFHSSDFDDKAAALLREVLVMHDSDLVAPPGGVRLATLSKSIKSLRLSGRPTATERNIMEVLKWLRKNYGDEHTPKMHKANDFCACWERFRTAWQRDVGEDAAVEVKALPADREARIARNKLKRRVRDKIVEQQGRNAMFCFTDRDIQRALTALGEDPDLLTEKDYEE